MKKYLVLLLFTVLMPLSLFAAEEVEIDGIRYALNNDGTAEVAMHYWSYCEGSGICLTIPSTICYEGETYTVTRIGNLAFSHSWRVVKFELPETITSIGDYAFGECGNLESINLPEGLLSLGRGTFYLCKKLKSIELPQSLISIGENCFCVSGLQSVRIPDSITEISNGCFCDCGGLQEIELPNSLVSIGDYAFAGVWRVEEIKLPESLISIGDNGLGGFHVSEMTIPKNVVSIGSQAIGSKTLIRLYVYAVEPPLLGDDAFCEYRTPLHRARLFVPAESVDAYRETEGWNKWWKILPLEEDPTSIDQTELTTDAPSAIYSINGTRLDNPQRGLNIIRDEEGKTKKVVR